MRLWREEEETKIRREEREFQFAMFQIRLLHATVNSFFTTMIAVAISWIATMLAISFVPDIPVETKVSVITSAWNMFTGWMIVVVAFLVMSFLVHTEESQ